jgi:hypothetical protein
MKNNDLCRQNYFNVKILNVARACKSDTVQEVTVGTTTLLNSRANGKTGKKINPLHQTSA